MDKTEIKYFGIHDWQETEEMLLDRSLDYHLDKTGSITINGNKFIYLEDMEEYLDKI